MRGWESCFSSVNRKAAREQGAILLPAVSASDSVLRTVEDARSHYRVRPDLPEADMRQRLEVSLKPAFASAPDRGCRGNRRRRSAFRRLRSQTSEHKGSGEAGRGGRSCRRPEIDWDWCSSAQRLRQPPCGNAGPSREPRSRTSPARRSTRPRRVG